MKERSLLLLAPVLAALTACGAPSSSLPTPTPTQAAPTFAPLRSVKPAPIYGLTFTFEETGLRPGKAVDYQAGGEIVLTFSCGTAPARTLTSPLAYTNRYTANGAGIVSGLVSMEMKPPVCPGPDGMRPLTIQIQNVVLTDMTHGVSVRMPDTSGHFD